MPGRPLSEILKTSEENETTGYNKDETDENDVGDFEEDGPLIQWKFYEYFHFYIIAQCP